MNILQNLIKHFLLVCRHKWHVFKLCCQAGIPLQGLLHDLSKFSPTEFRESVKYYNGKRSPLAVSREINGYSKAWLHHKGRNKHHWEYWIDGYNKGGYGCIMPFNYACEMICDMIAATKVYNGKCFTTHGPLQYFERQTYGQFVHPQIQDFMRAVFTAYVEEGDAMITKQRLLNLYNSYFRCDVRNDG